MRWLIGLVLMGIGIGLWAGFVLNGEGRAWLPLASLAFLGSGMYVAGWMSPRKQRIP